MSLKVIGGSTGITLPDIADTASTLGTSYLPSQLTMRQVANQRVFDWPIQRDSPGLIALEPTIGDDLTRWGRYTRSGVPTTTVNADGSITVAASGGGAACVDFVSGFRPKVLALAAEVTIKSGFTPGDIQGLEVGVRKEDGSAGVWSYYNGSGVGFSRDGAAPTGSAGPSAFTVDTTQDLTIGCYITEPTFITYVRQGDKTAYVTSGTFTLDGTAANNRLPATLRDWRLGFSLQPIASKSITVTKFAAAYMPAESFSNPKVVTYKDGTPYTENGKYFFTGTVHTSNTFTDHSTAVFSFDPETYRATLVSHLFGQISGSILHLGPGHLFYDPDTDMWNWLVATWGPTAGVSTGVDLAYGTTARDVIKGGVFTIPLTVQTIGTLSYYDACARWDEAAGKWRVGAIETTTRTAWTGNHAVYLEGTSLTSLAVVRNDTTHENYQDGAQWAKIGGVWYLIYGTSTSFAAYDATLTTASYTALPSWSANSPSALWGGFGGYMSHAAVLAVSDDTQTRYIALCYGADVQGPTSLRGSLVVLEADEKPTGLEFPRRKILRAI